MERDGKWFYYYDPYQTPVKPSPECDDYFERLQEYNQHPMNLERTSIPFNNHYDNSDEYVQQFHEILDTTQNAALKASMQSILDTGQYSEIYVERLSVKTSQIFEQRVAEIEPPDHLVKRYEGMIQEVLENAHNTKMEGVEETEMEGVEEI